MAIVTGDRYLEFLVSFVEKNAGPLLEGTQTLKLNPVGLHYVQSRLEALRELEGLLAGAPVDYLRAYVSDLGDHRALEQLRRILGLLTSLKVISVLPSPARDPTPLSLLPFGRLRVLELRGCDLSTSAAKGLLKLRHSLEKLICHNSTDALRHVFASRIADIKDSPVWGRLSFLSCACNGLVLMDESLQLLPAVETLDLSRNRFAKVDNLRKCTKLQHLDLGFNHLRTVASLSEALCPIVKLVLRNNALTSLRGIENLKSVEGLDLSYNIISNFSELEILSSLSSLQNLWLEGNPICCARWYRSHVFSFFPHPEKLEVDGKGIKTREYWERHIILASKQKRPTGYGFYFPAKDDAEDKGSMNTKTKKLSRLALIEDEEQRRYFGPETVDQDSLSCDGDNMRKEENVISDGEAEIIGLMNRVEFMKKERSVLWLREFKEWMDQTTECMVDHSNCTSTSSCHTEEKCTKQVKGYKCPGESSISVQMSEGESSTNVLESDMSFRDIFVSAHGNEYFDCNGKTILEPSVLDSTQASIGVLGVEGMGSERDQQGAYSKKPLCPPSEATESFPANILEVKGGDQEKPKITIAPLTAIEEIMESRSSSINPASPPHYQVDLLHRRQNLEEEFFQLSAGSLSLASSDSDTSCSDNDSCRSGTSIFGLDRQLREGFIKQGIGYHSSEFPSEENHCDERHEDAPLRDDSRLLSYSCAQVGSRFSKNLLLNHGKPVLSHEVEEEIASNDNDQIMSQEVGSLEKGKGKWKSKRRVVSLLAETFSVPKQLSLMLNGIVEVGKADTKDGHERPSCIENDIHISQEDAEEELAWIHKVKGSSINCVNNSSFPAKPGSLGYGSDDSPGSDELVKKYFHSNIADFGVSETCLECVHCDCISEEESGYQERAVAVLLSSRREVYILLLNATPEGPETITKVLGCHRLEDVREVVIGLGLQALRVHIEEDATYLFLTRTIEKSSRLLCLLQVTDSSAISNVCSIRSWEQVQVELFEKHICGGLKMSIFLYSMLLFWHDKCEGESWLSRSLFVIEGYMLVCIENLVQFSNTTDDFSLSSPYFSLDSCCPIQNILEMVIEHKESRCLTLTLDHVTSRRICFPGSNEKERNLENKTLHAFTWKLKWFSEDTLLKFVALLKAIHAGLTSAPLPVKCVC